MFLLRELIEYGTYKIYYMPVIKQTIMFLKIYADFISQFVRRCSDAGGFPRLHDYSCVGVCVCTDVVRVSFPSLVIYFKFQMIVRSKIKTDIYVQHVQTQFILLKKPPTE